MTNKLKLIIIILLIIVFTKSLIENYTEIYYNCTGVSEDECIYRYYEFKGYDRINIRFGNSKIGKFDSILFKGEDIVIAKNPYTAIKLSKENLSLSTFEKVTGIFTLEFWFR